MGSTKMNNGIMFHRYLFSLHPTFLRTYAGLTVDIYFEHAFDTEKVLSGDHARCRCTAFCLVALRFLITFSRKLRSLCLGAGLDSELADTLTSKPHVLHDFPRWRGRLIGEI